MWITRDPRNHAQQRGAAFEGERKRARADCDSERRARESSLRARPSPDFPRREGGEAQTARA
jgi:hypothetical protein